eukprot:299403-Amphidinium_carterae.1
MGRPQGLKAGMSVKTVSNIRSTWLPPLCLAYSEKRAGPLPASVWLPSHSSCHFKDGHQRE